MLTAATLLLSSVLTPPGVVGESPDSIHVTPPPPTVQYRTESTQVVTYDYNGEVAAEIVVRRSPEGEIRFDATFPDGAALNAVFDTATMADVGVTVECVDCESARAQIAEVMHYVEVQAGWVPCALHSVMTVIEVAHVNPIAVASAVLAACECLPLLVEEIEHLKCPGF